MVYKGVSVPVFPWTNLSNLDFEKIKSLGLNSVYFTVWWSSFIEPDEFKPRSYSEENLTKLRGLVDKAKNYGFTVFVALRHSYDKDNPKDYHGWADKYGGDYVNLAVKDASGWTGEARFSRMVEMFVQRFPDVILNPWHFPYHKESPLTDEQVDRYYKQTFPSMLAAIRRFSSNKIVFMPIHQGVKNGLTTGAYADLTPYTDKAILYGLNGHDGRDSSGDYWRIYACQHANSWNYDREGFKLNYDPALSFKRRYNVEMVSPELGALCIHAGAGSVRPVDVSRLAWLEEGFKCVKELGASWFYHRYEVSPEVECPFEVDGSVNEVGLLIKKYAVVVPDGNNRFLLLLFFSFVVFGLVLMSGYSSMERT